MFENSTFMLVPIEGAGFFAGEDYIDISEMLEDIKKNVKLEENKFSTYFISGTPYWADYNGTSYQVAINDNNPTDKDTQVAVQILKTLLEYSPLRKKVSVHSYTRLKVKL